MLYKGMEGDKEVYQAVVAHSGSAQFKIASGDGSWTSQYFVADGEGIPAALQAELNYALTKGDGGQSNNTVTLEDGTWSFKMMIDTSVDSGVAGDFIIQECSGE
jgi:pullulanase